MAPVVDDVVAQIEAAGVAARLVQAAGHAPVAAGTVGQEVVMEAADVAADGGGVTVTGASGVVLMTGNVEGLGDEAALEGDVLGGAGAEGFVDGPANRAVVDDVVVGGGQTHAIH